MAEDDDLAEIFEAGEEGFANPEAGFEVVGSPFPSRAGRKNASVDETVTRLAMFHLRREEEIPMGLRDFVIPAFGIAITLGVRSDCLCTPIGEGPKIVIRGNAGKRKVEVRPRLQEHLLVVAPQIDAVCDLGEVDRSLDDARGIGAAIDIVTDEDHRVCGGRRDQIQKLAELHVLPMNIPDRVDHHQSILWRNLVPFDPMRFARFILLAAGTVFAATALSQGIPPYTWIRQGHSSTVTGLAAAANGNVASFESTRIRVWKSSDRSQVASLNGNATIYSASFYPDSTKLVLSTSAALRVYTASTLVQEGTDISISDVGRADYIEIVKIGTATAMLTIHGTKILRWNLVGSTWTRDTNVATIASGWTRANLSANGKWVALSRNSSDSVQVFDFANLTLAPRVAPSTLDPWDVDFNPAGTLLAVGSTSAATGVQFYNVPSSAALTLNGTSQQNFGARMVRFDSTGNNVYTVDANYRLAYGPRLGVPVWRSNRSYSRPEDLKIAGGNYAVLNGFQYWPAVFTTAGLGNIFPAHYGDLNSIAAASSFVYTGGSDSYLSQWSSASSAEVRTTYPLAGDDPDRVVASQAANRVVIAGGGAAASGSIQILDLNLSLLKRIPLYTVSSSRELAISPVTIGSSGYVLAFTDGESLNVVRLSDGAYLRFFMDHTQDITSIAFSKDGSRLATGGRDDIVRIYNTATWTKLADVSVGSDVFDVAFGFDSSRIYTANDTNAQTIRAIERISVSPELWGLQPGFPVLNSEDVVTIEPSRDHTSFIARTANRTYQYETAGSTRLRYFDVKADGNAAVFSQDNGAIFVDFGQTGFGSLPNTAKHALASNVLSKTSVVRGSTFTATVTLNLPAAAGGATVRFTTNNSGITPTTSDVTIAAGAKTATLLLTTSASMPVGNFTVTAQTVGGPSLSHWRKVATIAVTN